MEKVKTFLLSLTWDKALPALLVFIIGIFAVKLLLKLFEKLLERSRLGKSLHGFVRAAVKILLWAILLLVVAGTLGVDVSSLVALLSVASLAITLAVQDFFANVAGGIVLLTSEPFEVGEYVEIDTIEGTVTEIGLVHTRINTADNKTIFIPNSSVASSRITNYTREEKRRVDLTFTASYDSPVEKVKEALTEACRIPQMLQDPPLAVRLSAYNASDIQYSVRIWVKTADYWDAYYAITENVKTVFDKEGIVMTYPHTIVHLEKSCST